MLSCLLGFPQAQLDSGAVLQRASPRHASPPSRPKPLLPWVLLEGLEPTFLPATPLLRWILPIVPSEDIWGPLALTW